MSLIDASVMSVLLSVEMSVNLSVSLAAEMCLSFDMSSGLSVCECQEEVGRFCLRVTVCLL